MKIEFSQEDIEKIRRMIRSEIGKMLYENHVNWHEKTKDDYMEDLK